MPLVLINPELQPVTKEVAGPEGCLSFPEITAPVTRAVGITLRYLDGLSVPEVAQHLDRTVHATEALLVRARNAFRVAYARGECDAD